MAWSPIRPLPARLTKEVKRKVGIVSPKRRIREFSPLLSPRPPRPQPTKLVPPTWHAFLSNAELKILEGTKWDWRHEAITSHTPYKELKYEPLAIEEDYYTPGSRCDCDGWGCITCSPEFYF